MKDPTNERPALGRNWDDVALAMWGETGRVFHAVGAADCRNDPVRGITQTVVPPSVFLPSVAGA